MGHWALGIISQSYPIALQVLLKHGRSLVVVVHHLRYSALTTRSDA
ncbi:hypothetical protein [Nostoc sp. CMAA1605]|nr:hypothetical protein [Nostoc sp. CMAA1605]